MATGSCSGRRRPAATGSSPNHAPRTPSLRKCDASSPRGNAHLTSPSRHGNAGSLRWVSFAMNGAQVDRTTDSIDRRPVATLPRTARTRVLVVEDEPDIAGLIKHTLERSGEL